MGSAGALMSKVLMKLGQQYSLAILLASFLKNTFWSNNEQQVTQTAAGSSDI